MLIPNAIKKFWRDNLKLRMSFVPTDRPTPKIGPINGEINMAPITTAEEFIFRPIEQITIEQIMIQTLYPLNVMSFRMLLRISSWFMFSSLNLKVVLSSWEEFIIRLFNWWIKPFSSFLFSDSFTGFSIDYLFFLRFLPSHRRFF